MKKQVSFCYCTEINIDRAKTSCTKKYVYEVYQKLGVGNRPPRKKKNANRGGGGMPKGGGNRSN